MRHPRRHEVFRDIGTVYRDKDEQEFVDVIEEPLEPDARDPALLGRAQRHAARRAPSRTSSGSTPARRSGSSRRWSPPRTTPAGATTSPSSTPRCRSWPSAWAAPAAEALTPTEATGAHADQPRAIRVAAQTVRLGQRRGFGGPRAPGRPGDQQPAARRGSSSVRCSASSARWR